MDAVLCSAERLLEVLLVDLAADLSDVRRFGLLEGLAVIGVEIHLLDLAHQRITGIGSRALVVECLNGHIVQSVEEVLLVGNILFDGGLDADLRLEFIDLLDQVGELFAVVLAAYAEVIGDLRIAREGVRMVVL